MAGAPALEVRGAVADTPFPYQPGYLSFREAPALLEAFARVESDPDAVLFDGHLDTIPANLQARAPLTESESK